MKIKYGLEDAKECIGTQWDQLASLITNGAMHIHPCFCPDYLAGQYAYWQATGRDAINKRTFKDELKFLKEIGAKFDPAKALDEAMGFKAALEDANTIFRWLSAVRAIPCGWVGDYSTMNLEQKIALLKHLKVIGAKPEDNFAMIAGSCFQVAEGFTLCDLRATIEDS